MVLCFGLMRPYKGLDVLLEAWPGIEGAELWIVGHAADGDRRRCAAPPRRTCASCRASSSDREIPAYFRRADLVVLPYRQIDQSGVLFTALAFGYPLLLSDVGGFPEVAATGAAELVAPGDPAALRGALTDLLEDPARRKRLGAAARAAAAGPYSWDTSAQDTLEVYRQLGVEL